MGWFLPLFSFGMLLLLTGSKAEVKETNDPETAVICTCPGEAEIPNVSLIAPHEHEGTSAQD